MSDDNSLTIREWKVLMLVGAVALLGIIGFVDEIRYLCFSRTEPLQIQRLDPFVPRSSEGESPRREFMDAIFEVPDGNGGTQEDYIRFAADDARIVPLEDSELPTLDINFVPGSERMLRLDGEHNWVSCVFVILISILAVVIWRYVLPEARRYAASEKRRASRR